VKNSSSAGSSGCQRVIADHLGDCSRFLDRKSVPVRQGLQLLQGESAAATGLGYQNAGPEALRSWRLAGFLGASPAVLAGTAKRLGALVGSRRPPVWISRTHGFNRHTVPKAQIGQSAVLHPVRLPRITVKPDGRTWQPLVARDGSWSAADNMPVLLQRYSHIVDRTEL
jgi:hypothetical protein